MRIAASVYRRRHAVPLAKLLSHRDVTVTVEFHNRVTDANRRAAAASGRLFTVAGDDVKTG